MVKIAYCLYGQPRNLEEGYKTISKFVENYDVDFYYHTWVLENNNDLYEHSGHRHININEIKYDENIIEKINSLYKPNAYLAELSKSFNDIIDDEFMNSIAYKNTNIYDRNNNRISNTLSNFYSKQQVRNLFYDKITKENREYDFVITSRFDMLKYNNVNLDMIDNKKNYFSDIHLPRYIFSDHILLLGVDNFLKLYDVYDNLHNLINNEELNKIIDNYNEKLVIVPEQLLFANYLFHFKNLDNVIYINFPNFRNI